MSALARLHPDDVEAIAARVLAGLLVHQAPAVGGMLTAAQVAERLGVTAEWVRDHAETLGAVRIGEAGPGKRPRLRFPLEAITAASSAATVEKPPAVAPVPRRRRRGSAAIELLPIGGRSV